MNAWMDAALLQAAGHSDALSVGASGGNLHGTGRVVSIRELAAVNDILAGACERSASDPTA